MKHARTKILTIMMLINNALKSFTNSPGCQGALFDFKKKFATELNFEKYLNNFYQASPDQIWSLLIRSEMDRSPKRIFTTFDFQSRISLSQRADGLLAKT